MSTSPLMFDVPILHSSCFGGFAKKASDGQSSICFEGYLYLPDGMRRAYFKTDPFEYAMLNEEIGYILARSVNLPQPVASKIWIQGKTLHDIDPIRWRDPNVHALCWVTYEAKDSHSKPAKTVKAKLRINASTPKTPELESAVRSIFVKFKLLGKLIAFDVWVANVDRNIGNVLLVSHDAFIIIDHGQILGGPNWPNSLHTSPSSYVRTKILDGIFGPPDTTLSLPAKNAIIKEYESFELAYKVVKPWLDTTLNASRGMAFSQAHDFLRDRSTGLLSQIQQKTGLVT